MICRICKIDRPETPEYFRRHKKYNNGLRSECKDCSNKLDRIWKQTNPQKRKEQHDRWSIKHPNKDKIRILNLMHSHPSCIVILFECACIHPRKHNHHPDYNKPFEVIRLCPSCHAAEHKRLRSLQPALAEAI